MLNFFRKIRRKLAFDNKASRYLRYAIGEVLLIMLGIFMALQLQNWNENRKKEAQFKNSLEQLYNKITDDTWFYSWAMRNIEYNISVIDDLLNFQDGHNTREIPSLIWQISGNYKLYQSQSLTILDNLEYNLNDSEQVNLANQLSDFKELIRRKYVNWYDIPIDLGELLVNNDIPFPKFDYKEIDKGLISDSTYYTPENFESAARLIKNPNFITRLKSLRTFMSTNYLDFKSLGQESSAVLVRIKEYHPDVKLLYEDVGIIGTSINGYDDVGAHSTPMILINEEKSIWEIQLSLKVGTVKFRCRDSWAINWGGNSFPEGTPEQDGPDIPVSEAGNYRIVLNLTANTYEFIKQDD